VPPSPRPPDQAKAPPRPPAPASAPVRLTIRILAFDAKTAAKVEAKVVEVNSGRPVSDGVANDSGTIVLDRVPRGRYRLVVSAPVIATSFVTYVSTLIRRSRSISRHGDF
jgi:hypothetical protein